MHIDCFERGKKDLVCKVISESLEVMRRDEELGL